MDKREIRARIVAAHNALPDEVDRWRTSRMLIDLIEDLGREMEAELAPEAAQPPPAPAAEAVGAVDKRGTLEQANEVWQITAPGSYLREKVANLMEAFKQDIEAAAVIKAENDRLRAEALRFYRADGTYETLGSAEEAVRLRIAAARQIADLQAENDTLEAALIETTRSFGQQRARAEKAEAERDGTYANWERLRGENEELRAANAALGRELDEAKTTGLAAIVNNIPAMWEAMGLDAAQVAKAREALRATSRPAHLVAGQRIFRGEPVYVDADGWIRPSNPRPADADPDPRPSIAERFEAIAHRLDVLETVHNELAEHVEQRHDGLTIRQNHLAERQTAQAEVSARLQHRIGDLEDRLSRAGRRNPLADSLARIDEVS